MLIATNLLELFSGFAPVFAILITRIPFLNRSDWFVLVQVFFLVLSGTVLSLYPVIVPHTTWLYPFFVVMFNFLFVYRFGVENFSKILAWSLMLTFLMTELHELPVFVFAYLRVFGHKPLTIIPWSQIYCLVVAGLLTKTSHLKITKLNMALFGLLIVALFGFYLWHLDIDNFYARPVLTYLKRFVCFGTLATIFYFWGDTK